MTTRNVVGRTLLSSLILAAGLTLGGCLGGNGSSKGTSTSLRDGSRPSNQHLKSERQHGATIAKAIKDHYGGVISSSFDSVHTYVGRVGDDVARTAVASGNAAARDRTYRFFVLDSSEFQHFSAPDGQIFVTRGLLEFLENEAQLRSVLAAEIGHVAGRHIISRIERAEHEQKTRETAGGVVDDLGDIFGRRAKEQEARELLALMDDYIMENIVSGEQGVQVEFTDTENREVDEFVVKNLVKSGYDPTQYLNLLQKYRERADSAALTAGDDLLRTHHVDHLRIDRVNEMIQAYPQEAMQEGKVGTSEYQESVLLVLQPE